MYSFAESHSTSTLRLGSSSIMFLQSEVWIVTPLPRVINPTTLSPGNGLQHPAYRTTILSTPLMRRASLEPPRVTFWIRRFKRPSSSSPCCSSLSGGRIFPIIWFAVTFPYPTAAMRSSTSLKLNSLATLANSPDLISLACWRSYFLSSFSKRSFPRVIDFSHSSVLKCWRILVLAREVLANLSQSLLGFWFGDVIISTVSPLRNSYFRETILLFTFAPTQ